MRAWITQSCIRLIAESQMERDMLEELEGRTFKAAEHLYRADGHKGQGAVAEIYLDEVK